MCLLNQLLNMKPLRNPVTILNLVFSSVKSHFIGDCHSFGAFTRDHLFALNTNVYECHFFIICVPKPIQVLEV